MTNKQRKRRLLLFILVLVIPLMISIGLSFWIISDNIQVKPELEIEGVIIKYLDKNETEYESIFECLLDYPRGYFDRIIFCGES